MEGGVGGKSWRNPYVKGGEGGLEGSCGRVGWREELEEGGRIRRGFVTGWRDRFGGIFK